MRGLGIDIVETARIRRLLQRPDGRFRARCYRPDEAELARSRGLGEIVTLASVWAAKEAFRKAVGRSWPRVDLHEIEVVQDADGAPAVRLHGGAVIALAAPGAQAAHLSLCATPDLAAAIVVIE